MWGTQTPETRLDERLINRFDYDGDYGTVLNRFLMQAAIGYPLTVHGTGGQTRAFIHIQDTCRCIELAIVAAADDPAPMRTTLASACRAITDGTGAVTLGSIAPGAVLELRVREGAA